MDSNGGMPAVPGGQILPKLFKEAQANNGLDIHHEKEESNGRQVQSMIDNYTSQLLLQQKQKASAASQQFRQFYNSSSPSSSQTGPPTTSHSQPCLFTIDGNWKQHSERDHRQQIQGGHSFELHPQQHSDLYEATAAYANGGAPIFYQETPPAMTSSSPDTIVLKISDYTALRTENDLLRQKTEALEQKVGKLRQLEQAYDHIEKEFEQVMLQRDKQEQLEKATVLAMEQQMQRLSAENSSLLQKLEHFNSSHATSNQVPQEPTPQDNVQLAQLTMLLNEYVAQNKDLQILKDRQKVEIEAQNVTLNEQRNHIDMLEKALSNAQDRLSAKDRQLLESSAIVDRCNHLQKQLQEMHDERQRRHEEFAKEKSQLEMQLTFAKMQIANEKPSPRKSRTSPEPEESSKLRRALAAKDEKIVQLETNLRETQAKLAEDLQRRETELKNEIDALNVKCSKLESEKMDKDRRLHDLVADNRRLHDQAADDRVTMERRFSALEEDIRRLAIDRASTSALYNVSPRQFSIAFPNHLPATATSVTSLHDYDDNSFPNEPTSDKRMEDLRKNIADRRHQTKSYVRPRLPAPLPIMTTSVPPAPLLHNAAGHLRVGSSPSGMRSPPPPTLDQDPVQIERQLVNYMNSLPPTMRRKFVVATGLEDHQFPTATPSLPEGAKLTLSRQASNGTPSSRANHEKTDSGHGVRIQLIEPSMERRQISAAGDSDPSDEEKAAQSEAEDSPTPPSGAFNTSTVKTTKLVDLEDRRFGDAQSLQRHTTTVVEVNKDHFGRSRGNRARLVLSSQPNNESDECFTVDSERLENERGYPKSQRKSTSSDAGRVERRQASF